MATSLLGGAGLILGLLFGWLGARPSRPLTSPRLIPWRMLMLIAFALTMISAVHLAALLKGS